MGNIRFAMKALGVLVACVLAVGSSVSASAIVADTQKTSVKADENQPFFMENKEKNKGLMPSAYHVPGSMLEPSGASLPLSYRSKITDVKNQGIYNTCWAFSNIAALESFLIKDGKGTYDLSENHLSWWSTEQYNSDGYGWQFTDLDYGGYSMVGAGYLASWQGAKLEEDFPYSSYGNSMPDNMEDGYIPYNVTGIMYVANDITSVKTAIKNYGGVATSYSSTDRFYNRDRSSYYQAEGDYCPGHAITIIGWDDDYSVDNFKEAPPADGAWLVKNSWGDSTCEDGLMWISYYDPYLLDTNLWGSNVVITSARTNSGYDRLYQNETYGATWYTYLNESDNNYLRELTFVNVFDFDQQHKYLQKVIFETRETGVSYKAYYIPVVNGVPDAKADNWIKLAAGKSNTSGYICVDTAGFELPSGVGAIGITVDSGDSSAYASMGVSEWLADANNNYVFFPNAHKNESFVIHDSTVYDLMDIYAASNDKIGGTLVIKALASEYRIGDVTGDGRSSTADALYILRNSLGMKYFDKEQMVNADTNFDGNITAADALRVQRKTVGLISDY